jgi:uncharacterized membrane protein
MKAKRRIGFSDWGDEDDYNKKVEELKQQPLVKVRDAVK